MVFIFFYCSCLLCIVWHIFYFVSDWCTYVCYVFMFVMYLGLFCVFVCNVICCYCWSCIVFIFFYCSCLLCIVWHMCYFVSDWCTYVCYVLMFVMYLCLWCIFVSDGIFVTKKDFFLCMYLIVLWSCVCMVCVFLV